MKQLLTNDNNDSNNNNNDDDNNNNNNSNNKKFGGRGRKSIESTYKNIKVKTAIKLYANEDPTMRMVREFE